MAKKAKLQTKWVNITPALAKAMLKKNDTNRVLRPGQVRVLAYAMKKGTFRATHQGIAFNCDGSLIDGQHRLHAIAQSNRPQRMLVTTGLPSDTRMVVDHNMVPRTIADVLNLSGNHVDNTNKRVACVKAMVVYPEGVHIDKYGSDQILELLNKHNESISFALAHIQNQKYVMAPVLAAVARAWYHVDHARLAEWGEVYCKGYRDGMDDRDTAAIVFRNWMIANRGMLGSTPRRHEVYLRAQNSIKAFARRRKVSQSAAAQKDLFPLV